MNTESSKYMRTAPKTGILSACLPSMVENDPLITLRKLSATKVVTTGVSVSQQLVHTVLKTPGYRRKRRLYSFTAILCQNRNDSIPRTERSL